MFAENRNGRHTAFLATDDVEVGRREKQCKGQAQAQAKRRTRLRDDNARVRPPLLSHQLLQLWEAPPPAAAPSRAVEISSQDQEIPRFCMSSSTTEASDPSC